MSLTVDDVKRLYAEEVAKGKSPKDAYNGTRTMAHTIMPVSYTHLDVYKRQTGDKKL